MTFGCSGEARRGVHHPEDPDNPTDTVEVAQGVQHHGDQVKANQSRITVGILNREAVADLAGPQPSVTVDRALTR